MIYKRYYTESYYISQDEVRPYGPLYGILYETGCLRCEFNRETKGAKCPQSTIQFSKNTYIWKAELSLRQRIARSNIYTTMQIIAVMV